MYTDRQKSICFLLLALQWGSGNFFAMKRVESASVTPCHMPKKCNVDGFNDWFKVDDRCVKYFMQPLNFSEAEYSCRAKVPGGHLMSVHDKKANNYLLCMVKKFNPKNLRFWLGGYELFQSGKFLWTDGSFWDYDLWVPGEPINIFNGAEECVEMNWKNVGQWNDDTCSLKKNYICAFKRKRLLNE